MKKLIFALTLMGLLGGHAPLTASQPVPDAAGYIVKVGDTAPDFEMKLTDGRKVKLSELKGKVVMLQFTASWCGVCRKEMPFIEKDIWQKHKDNASFALYGIDRDEPLERVIRNSLMTSLPILILHLLNSRIRRQLCGSQAIRTKWFSLSSSRICIGEQLICQKQAIM